MSELSDFFFTSAPAAVRFQLLEIYHPSFSTTYRIVRNSTGGVYVNHENEDFPTFYQYLPMRIEEIGSDNSMDQSLEVTIGDLGELIPIEIELATSANTMNTKPTLTYREYRSDSAAMQGVDGGDWIFDGIDDAVTIDPAPGFSVDINDSFSVAGWFTTTGSSAATLIAKEVEGPSFEGWMVALTSSGELFFRLEGTPSPGSNKIEISSIPTYNDGDRHFFCITKSSATTASGVIIYVDGVEVTSVTVGFDALSGSMLNSADMKIGMWDTTNPFEGQLEHFTLWDSALTAGQVASLYNNGTPPNVATAVGAVTFENVCEGWWRLDYSDTIGAFGVTDHSPIGRPGTAEGGLSPVGTEFAPVMQTVVYGPVHLEVTDINFSKEGATFSAKPKLFNRTRTGQYYIPERFPMLKGFL